MANVLVESTSLIGIADEIRSKNGSSTTYKPSEMAAAISAISGGGITPTGEISIVTNGTHDVTNYASANVSVPTEGGITPTGSISITENGTFAVTNFASAIVNVATGGGGDLPTNVKMGTFTFDADSSITLTITHGGTTTPIAIFVLCDNIDDIAVVGTVGGIIAKNIQGGISSSSNGTLTYATTYTFLSNLTETSFDVTPRASYPFKTGLAYRWFAWY